MKWLVSWKWASGKGHGQLTNTAEEYRIPCEARREYEQALQKWADKGWLVPYDEQAHGEVKSTIPLMVMIQREKRKVRSFTDFREMN